MTSNKQPERPIKRAGYSVAEFSALFGRGRSWGYRQIEHKRVTPVIGYGATIIPAVEVDRMLGKREV